MSFLILGSGGRENAIIKCLLKNQGNIIYCISNVINRQISDKIHQYHILDKDKLFNCKKLVKFIKEKIPDKKTIIVPGSENFLEIGLVDLLVKEGYKCIGPKKNLAMLETSKSYCRDFIKRCELNQYQPRNISIYKYDIKHLENIFELLDYRFVIKADGLCGGKGVRIYDESNFLDAFDYCKELCKKKHSEVKFVIEELLFGEEFSLISFCDGNTIKHMPQVKDYKDLGLNSRVKTGGMGCIILADHSFPYLSDEDIVNAQAVNEKVMNLQEEPYIGILYGGFMKTDDGIKLIEYNVRFGDPESIVLLSLLETPLGTIFEKMVSQKLFEIDVNFKKTNAICKYIVPTGYPHGMTAPVKINNTGFLTNVSIDSYLASVDGIYNFCGSRAIAIVEHHDNMEECCKNINQNISILQDNYIDGHTYYRHDIGSEFKVQDKYLAAGINIEEGELVVSRIQDNVVKTYDSCVINNFGDYGGLYDIGKKIKELKFRNPILVSSTDGIGTKIDLVLDIMGLKLGLQSLGKDIVGHSVNDILVKGAVPLFFLDYVASSKIISNNISYLLEGISEACISNEVSIMGGETAEMPGIYQSNKYDIVGTIVGVCDKNNIIEGKKNIKPGNLVYGIPSSGPHTNGYTLIRKIINDNRSKIDDKILEMLIKPHRSYLNDVHILQRLNIKINGLAHITGGGFYGNVKRVLPENCLVRLDIPILEPFETLRKLGNVSYREMYSVFNCGYGMLFFVDEGLPDNVILNEGYTYLGKVESMDSGIVDDKNGGIVEIQKASSLDDLEQVIINY